ncbi:MAG: hypothetical protein ACLUD2_05610 [Clostridium sp.]
MPLLKDHYTSEDYWNLPENERAELIDGKLYSMAPPSLTHQTLSIEIAVQHFGITLSQRWFLPAR